MLRNAAISAFVALACFTTHAGNAVVGCSYGTDPASDDIDFTRLGILSRDKIVPLIVEKLKGEGKLVVVREV